MEVQSFGIEGFAAFALGCEAGFEDAVGDTCLYVAADIHDVQREQLAGDSGEGHVEVDFHLLASAFVDDEFGVDRDSAIVGPFSPDEVED
jgi:hypothetical protein